MVWSVFYLNYLATLYRQAIDHQAYLKVFESMMQQQQPLYDFFLVKASMEILFSKMNSSDF